ncbi:MAG: hypothetical protein ACOCQL_05820, partial [Halolamina sp.]
VLVIVFVGIGALSGGSDAVVGALGVVGILLFLGGFVLALVIYYALGFLIQFHPAAIVVEDRSLVESVRRSVDLVRTDPLGALGYSVLVAVVSGTVGAVPAAYITVTGGFVEIIGQENPEALLGAGLLNAGVYFLLFVVIRTFLLPFLRTYHVAYYVTATE